MPCQGNSANLKIMRGEYDGLYRAGELIGIDILEEI